MKKFAFLFLAVLALFSANLRAATPKVGDAAPDFTLRTLDDRIVELKALTEKSPVVLIMLRGWPGYQCPICTVQVHDFVAKAAEFRQRGVQVLMVYPGPAQELKAHADDFLRDKNWPADFLFLIDPGYTFTSTYGLRWEAQKETAYPSLFVINRAGKVTFAHVSKTHGDRVSATQALAELK